MSFSKNIRKARRLRRAVPSSVAGCRSETRRAVMQLRGDALSGDAFPGAPAPNLLECRGDKILGKLRIGARYVGCRQTVLAADDICTLSSCGAFIKCDQAVGALTAKPAIGGDDEVLHIDVLQRFADVAGNLLGSFSVKRPVGHDADGKLFPRLTLPTAQQFEFGESPVLHLKCQDIAFNAIEINFQRVGVRRLVEYPLHHRISPAGMNPYLSVLEPLQLVVQGLCQEVERVGSVGVVASYEMDRWLFDLDDATARG